MKGTASRHAEHASFVRVRVIRDRPLQGLPMGWHRGPLQLCTEDAPAFDPRDALGCTRGTIVSQVTEAAGNSFMHGCGHYCRLCIHVNGIPASDRFYPIAPCPFVPYSLSLSRKYRSSDKNILLNNRPCIPWTELLRNLPKNFPFRSSRR